MFVHKLNYYDTNYSLLIIGILRTICVWLNMWTSCAITREQFRSDLYLTMQRKRYT